MSTAADETRNSSERRPIKQRMLFVGPLPPPRTGTHVSFQILCDETRSLSASPDHLQVIDTSQKKLKKTTKIASTNNLRQAWHVLNQFRKLIKTVDHALVFGSNGFIFSMTPLLQFLARRAGKKFYVRVCGGSIDQFAEKLNPIARWLLYRTLRNSDGVAVQTQYLQSRLQPILGDKVFSAPGQRYIPDLPVKPARDPADSKLRLIFVALVREDKGIFVLLQSLRDLHASGIDVHCDIYGEVWPACEERFRREVADVPNADFRGYLEPKDVIPTMYQYDALVLPTYYQGEGHPGVLIEAMMAGTPAISTDFRSVPEVVEHGVTGLLVPPQDSAAIGSAITKLAAEPHLLQQMSHNCVEHRSRFDAKKAVPAYLATTGLLT